MNNFLANIENKVGGAIKSGAQTVGNWFSNMIAKPKTDDTGTMGAMFSSQKPSSPTMIAPMPATKTGDSTALGIAENTVKGIPQAAVTVGSWLFNRAKTNYENQNKALDMNPQLKANGKMETPKEARTRGLKAMQDLAVGFAGPGGEGGNALQKVKKPLLDKLAEIVNPEEVKTILSNIGVKGKALINSAENIAATKSKAIIKGILRDTPIEQISSKARAKAGGTTKIPSDVKKAPTGQIRAKGESVTPKVTAPKGAPEMKSVNSVGDILANRGTEKPPVSREIPTLPQEGKPLERRFITRVKHAEPGMADMLQGQYERRSTKALVQEADNLIKSDRTEATRVATTDASEKGVATASRLIDTYIKEARNAATDGAKNEAWDKAAEIANAAAANLTEHGKAIQAASILGRMTPEGMVRYAAREIQKYNEVAGTRNIRNFLGGAKKIPELTGEQVARITSEMKRIQEISDPTERGIAFANLNKEIRNYLPSSLYQKIIAIWKAGLLTGIKTTGLNVISNISHMISEIAKDVPGAIVDKIVSLFTGERRLVFTTKGSAKGFAEGIQKGWKFMKTGYDERNALSKLDWHQVNFGKGRIAKMLQAYEEKVFGLLGSEDQPFYYAAKARSLASQAIAEAKNEGLKGNAYTNRIKEIMANPTDEMLKLAVMDAQTAVFQNKTMLGTVARSIQKIPGGELLLPFGRTPSAVATQLINYTPVGIAKTIIDNIGKGRFNQRLFSQGLGRGLTGTAVLAIGAALYKAGLMTATRPTSQKDLNLWSMEGKHGNMIKINGVWRNVNVLGPLGFVIAVGANMEQGFEQSGSFIGGLGAAAAGAGSSLTQQTFLYGINQAINALNDPTHYGSTFIRNTIGSIVPTIVADVARATDTNERQVNTAGEKVTSRIPGLREHLQPQVDAFGKKIKTPDFWTVMVDMTRPGNPTENTNDPVVKELQKLSDAGFNPTPTMVGGKHGYKSLTENQNTRLWQVAGQLAKKNIEDIMANSYYHTWDAEQKSKVLEKVVQQAKDQARGKIVYEATKGLTGKTLTDKLQSFANDKLLTRTVEGWYASYKRKNQ